MLLDNEWSSDFLNIKSWIRVAKLWCIAYEEYLYKTYKRTRKCVDALWLPGYHSAHDNDSETCRRVMVTPDTTPHTNMTRKRVDALWLPLIPLRTR